jgi:hypothetical protein
MTQRNRDWEGQFLDHAARAAGLSGAPAEQFRERVWARMDKGAADDGSDDGFWRRGFERVVDEGRVEAEDIAAYCLGAAQVIAAADVDDEVIHTIRLHLQEAVSASLRAWSHLDVAVGLFEDSRAGRRVAIPRPRAISDGA